MAWGVRSRKSFAIFGIFHREFSPVSFLGWRFCLRQARRECSMMWRCCSRPSLTRATSACDSSIRRCVSSTASAVVFLGGICEGGSSINPLYCKVYISRILQIIFRIFERELSVCECRLDRRAITGFLDDRTQLRHVKPRGIIAHGCPLGLKVHCGAKHAGRFLKLLGKLRRA